MNKYFIKAILLEKCVYSMEAKNLLDKYNISHQIIMVNEKDKELYKTNRIYTYPQIYLNKYDRKGNLLLGGYSDLKLFIENFYEKEYNDITINNFKNKYNWSKKAILRLVQLINN